MVMTGILKETVAESTSTSSMQYTLTIVHEQTQLTQIPLNPSSLPDVANAKVFGLYIHMGKKLAKGLFG